MIGNDEDRAVGREAFRVEQFDAAEIDPDGQADQAAHQVVEAIHRFAVVRLMREYGDGRSLSSGFTPGFGITIKDCAPVAGVAVGMA
jgi:hypothetical protein